MRKRRVLALLLALSLVVSGNGMTVLAAEQGPDMPVLASQEDTQENDDKSGENGDTSGNTEDASKDGDTSGEDKQPSTEETPAEGTENPENPDESDPSEPKEDDAEQGGDQSGDQTGSEDDGQSGDQTDTEGEDGTQDEPSAETQEPTVSENDVKETEEPEEELVEKTAEVRMMSFTDASGLQITFDANAAAKNADKVVIVDGVLTGVKDGETVKGVVDLREKTEITRIGTEAFKGNTGITYVMLPNTVVSLEKGAFQDCSALKGISIPSRLQSVGELSMAGCTALTQVALPNSVQNIGNSAFKGDSRLFMVHMRSADFSKLTVVGDNAFEGCFALEMFCSDETYNLPDSIETIGAGAFKDCARIKAVEMGDKLAELASGAYQGCTGITKVTISADLAKIPSKAFSGCTGLTEIEFPSTGSGDLTIAGEAFENCRKLTSVDLPQTVSKVEANAFTGCTSLVRVKIGLDRAILKKGAFPNGNAGLCIMGTNYQCSAYQYAKDNGNLKYIATEGTAKANYYYTYTLKATGPMGTDKDPIKLSIVKDSGESTKDINDITNNDGLAPYTKGVKEGTECRVVISWGKDNIWKNSIRLVPGSLKYNGKEMAYDKGRYHFAMPCGGATVTAEFEHISVDDSIQGSKDTIEGRLSSDVDYDFERNIAYMKVGQSAKFYLTNNYGGTETRIPTPSPKVSYKILSTSTNGVVSIDGKTGVIKALKEGTATVRAEVTVKDGDPVLVDVTIDVEKAGIDHISVLLPNINKTDINIMRNVEVEKDEKGRISGIFLPTIAVEQGREIDIEATAFTSEEDDEEMAVAFSWTSSDTSVARVRKGSTAAADSKNQVIIPQGADGEATITVSATGGDGKKVSQKFVVSVQNYAPRLDTAKVTVNPNQTISTATIGIIDAYGKAIAAEQTIKAWENKENGKETGFIFNKIGEKEGDVTTYRVTALASVPDGTYKVKLKVTVQGYESSPFELPLTIVVKKSFPKPTVSFDKKAPKINLFLANDGTEIKPVIGKLGEHDVISECWLEPLTVEGHKNFDNDKLFTGKFMTKKNDSGEWVIIQKIDELKKNTSKKPVLTGYLCMRFEGYDSKQIQKYKITIPTQTVAPSYVLDRTKDTFGAGFNGEQVVTLMLLDKKTKKPVAWEEGFSDTESIIDPDKTTFLGAGATLTPVEQMLDGAKQRCIGIRVTIPASPLNKSGRLGLKVHNSKWAEDKVFVYTYNIAIDTKPQAYSLKKATITLNANYPERVETFELVSNHRDEVIQGTQGFEPQSTAKNAIDYDKLSVTCADGKGSISLKELQPKDTGIKTGNYRYIYRYKNTEGKDKAVTLTVKVIRTTPTVALKGTNSFNLTAKDGDSYVETSEMALTVKNLPDNPKYVESPDPEVPETSGTEPASAQAEPNKSRNEEFYSLDETATVDSVKITTRKYENLNAKEYFDFEWVEDENGAGGKFRISLKKEMDTTTYNLQMTPTFKNVKNIITTAKPVGFKIKVYKNTISSVKLKARGKINLLDRRPAKARTVEFVYTEKNGILYTPTIANLNDTLQVVVLLDDYVYGWGDYSDTSKHSKLFEAHITEDKKSFYIVPKEGAALENKKTYKVYAWLRMENYKFGAATGNGIYSDLIKVNTAEILPKVKTDKTTADLFMSSKNYEAVFTVRRADDKAVGTIKDIAFGEKDEKAKDSFEVRGVKQPDGSLKVYLKLKKGVSYKCNSTNKIKMYIQFEGQGTNTEGTPITMSVKINK